MEHSNNREDNPEVSQLVLSFFSPVEGAAAISLPVAVVGLPVVVLLGEETGGQHTPDAAEHVHGGGIHHIVDLQERRE